MGKISSFIMGALAGACVALAFAPQAGEKTRALIAEKANALAEEAKDFGAGLPGSAQDAAKAAREQGSSLLKDAQSKVMGTDGASSEADADELREKIEAARQRIAAQVMENAEKAKAEASDAKEATVETVEKAADAAEDKAKKAADAVAEKAEDAKHAK